jgi:hypothetical protein
VLRRRSEHGAAHPNRPSRRDSWLWFSGCGNVYLKPEVHASGCRDTVLFAGAATVFRRAMTLVPVSGRATLPASRRCSATPRLGQFDSMAVLVT